jgi:D-threo-aldose 1-dehydrogenase
MPTATPPIEQRRLGRSRLQVSSIIVGCAGWQLRDDGGGPTEAESIALTSAILEDEVLTTLDTANNYGFGASERRVRSALDATLAASGQPRAAGLFIQTKADRAPNTNDFSGSQIRRSVEQSLERLGVSQLPMVYLHDPENTTWDKAVASDGPVAELVRLRDEGVVQNLGISGGPADMLERFIDLGHFNAVITHNRYTLVDRSAEHLLGYAAAAGVAVLNAAPYGGGILTRTPRTTDRYAYSTGAPALLAAVDMMAQLAADADVSLAALALQFSLRDPRITATIVGMQRLNEYNDTLKLAATPIPDEVWARVDAVPLDPNTWQDALMPWKN